MMKNIKAVLVLFPLFLLTVFAITDVHGAENDVYQEVYDGITAVNHRLAGSEEFERSAQILEKSLAAAGVTSYRQTFNTAVPHSIACEFRVDGQRIPGIYPIAPSIISLSTTGEQALTGPLLYLGRGDQKDFNHKTIKGAIVLLDVGSKNSALIFNEGAQAIIYVGNEDANQYAINRTLTHSQTSIPHAFLLRSAAEKHGLLQKYDREDTSPKQAQLQIHSSWEEKEASNIWVHIPASNPTNFNYGNEAIVLCATLDTFGYVPDYCPQKRDAANVALLAETCVSLSKASLKRDVYVVFLGSHHALQEGARYFYFVEKKREHGDYFKTRLAHYKQDIKSVRSCLEFLALDNPLTQDHPAHREGKKAIRLELSNIIDDLNFDIRKLSLRAQAGEENLGDRITELRSKKGQWNELLGDLTLKNMADEKRSGLYKQILHKTTAYYESLQSEINKRIQHNKSYQLLENHIGDKTIVSHFSFDFANTHSNWILNYSGDFRGLYNEASIGLGFFKDHVEELGMIYQESLADNTNKNNDTNNSREATGHLVSYRHNALRSESLLYPNRRSLSSFAALGAQHFGYNLASLDSPLERDQLPFTDDYNLHALSTQCSDFFVAVCNSKKVSVTFSGPKTEYIDLAVYEKTGLSNYGVRFKNLVKGGSEIAGPSQGALTVVSGAGTPTAEGPSPLGYIRAGLSFANGEGHIFSPNLNRPQSGGYASGYQFDDFGAINRIGMGANITAAKGIIKLYYCYSGTYYTPMMPLSYEAFSTPTAYKGKNNSKLVGNMQIIGGNKSRSVFYNKETAVKLIDTQSGLTLLGTTDSAAQGYGFDIDPISMQSINTIQQVARDLGELNEERLQNLRSKNIILDDIETLHANAKDHFQKAEALRQQGLVDKAQAHELFAATLENHAYQPLVDVSNDMIQAVVILLILSIPFAFSLERLFFGFTTIYKQVMGFLGMFLSTFGLLYIVHPAFSFASSPTIIFLAFVIILMSGMVIVIIMSKFKREILALQGLAGNSHSHKKEGNIALASVVIGISGMRNRPLKTFLTALTIILLTFTILVFASFGSQIQVNEKYVGQSSSVDRIEIQREGYLKLPEHLYNSLNAIYNEQYHVMQRGAYFSYPFDLPKDIFRQNAIYVPVTGESLKITAALGFDPAERAMNPDLNAIYPETFDQVLNNSSDQDQHPILLHTAVSTRLHLKVGDTVTMLGITYTFAGNYNEKDLVNLSYLNGDPAIPPNFKETMEKSKDLQSAGSTKIGEVLKSMDTSSFRWTMPEDIAVINHADLSQINGFTNAYTLYPKVDTDIYKDSHDVAEIFNGTIMSKGSEGVKSFFYSSSFSTDGLGDIIVPLLLGGLIIFSSLLGSIVDREREIFTFSALGLAPPNVAALFFAESSVYAVIGGLGGYIISQLAAVLLAWLSDLGVFQAPDMNFSSLSSTYTILLVMATVLLSTVVPAMKASKSANPGISRKWKMPVPEDGKMSFLFPFTASTSDIGGILTFLSEHFESHSDASLGSFASSEVTLIAQDGGHYSLGSKVSLAPFDLGIYQQFTMSSQESDIPGILEIRIELDRLSGSPGSWMRSNRKFIDGLRQQFLLWRSLPPETVSHYIQLSKKIDQDVA